MVQPADLLVYPRGDRHSNVKCLESESVKLIFRELLLQKRGQPLREKGCLVVWSKRSTDWTTTFETLQTRTMRIAATEIDYRMHPCWIYLWSSSLEESFSLRHIDSDVRKIGISVAEKWERRLDNWNKTIETMETRHGRPWDLRPLRHLRHWDETGKTTRPCRHGDEQHLTL